MFMHDVRHTPIAATDNPPVLPFFYKVHPVLCQNSAGSSYVISAMPPLLFSLENRVGYDSVARAHPSADIDPEVLVSSMPWGGMLQLPDSFRRPAPRRGLQALNQRILTPSDRCARIPAVKKRRTLTVFAMMHMVRLIGSVLGGCASPRDIRKEFEPYGLFLAGEHRIYVATEDTPWKQEVVTQLSVELGRDYSLTVENLQTLNQIRIDDWDVVIILSTFYAFGLQSDTAVFMEALEQRDRVILVVTSAISDLEDSGVDSVTAASVGNTKEDAESLTPKKEPGEIALQLAQSVFSKTEE